MKRSFGIIADYHNKDLRPRLKTSAPGLETKTLMPCLQTKSKVLTPGSRDHDQDLDLDTGSQDQDPDTQT